MATPANLLALAALLESLIETQGVNINPDTLKTLGIIKRAIAGAS